MSSHPNALLMAVFKPDHLSRKLARDIIEEHGSYGDESCIHIKSALYHVLVMEGDYNENFQIAAPEGSVVVFAHVTYGFGESVTWNNFEKEKKSLSEWADDVCKKHHCSFEIWVSANYW